MLPLTAAFAEPAPDNGHGLSEVHVRSVLAALAPRQRAVMHLTVMEGMTDSEISTALGVSAASVRSHRRRAKEAILRCVGRGNSGEL